MTLVIGHAPVSAVVPLTSATLPAELLIAMVPLASDAGKFAPVAFATVPSCTKKYLPAAIVQPTAQMGVTIQLPVPAADWYCTDQFVIVTLEPPRLKIS